MATTYSNPAGRIGVAKAQILKAAKPMIVLGISGKKHKMKAKNSDTVRYRRWIPQGGSVTGTGRTLAANINKWSVNLGRARLTEGVTPDASHLQYQDIDVRIGQYGILFAYTDVANDLNEENIRKPMRMQAGQSAALLMEKIRYAKLRACINKSYSGNATNRQSVTKTLGRDDLRMASMILGGNRSKRLKSALRDPKAGNDIAQIEQAYCVFCHTNCEDLIRNIPDFKNREQYAGVTMPIHQNEIGAVENFRFIMSPELTPYPGAGGTVQTSDGVFSTSNKADVYPFLFVAQDAWADVTLTRDTMFRVKEVTPDTESKSDAMNQLGYISVKFYAAAFIMNEGWMMVIESAASNPGAV